MPNNFDSNKQLKLLRKFLPAFDSSVVSLNTVDHGEIVKASHNESTGDTVYVKRPLKYMAVDTDRGDLTGTPVNDMTSGRAAAKVQKTSTVRLEWEAWQEALEMDQLTPGSSEQVAGMAASELAVHIEGKLNDFMIENGSHQLGTAGSAISSWDDISVISAYTDSLAFPAGRIYGQINPYDFRALAKDIKSLNTGNYVSNAWERAQIPGLTGNVQLYKSALLSAHTVGNHDGGLTLSSTPVQTYVAGKDTFQTVISIAGGNPNVTGFLKAGDKVQIAGRYFNNLKSRRQAAAGGGAGLLYTATVAADVNTDGSGNATVTLNGPAFYEADGQFNTISSPLTSGDTVNVISGTANDNYVPNLFYHGSAFSVSSLAQKILKGWPTTFKSKYGLQMRFTDFSDGVKNENYMRIDTVPIFGALNPLLAGTFYGS